MEGKKRFKVTLSATYEVEADDDVDAIFEAQRKMAEDKWDAKNSCEKSPLDYMDCSAVEIAEDNFCQWWSSLFNSFFSSAGPPPRG